MSQASILPHASVVDFGVLGTQLSEGKDIVQVAPEPDDDTAIVDPAGLPHIQVHGPGQARGAAGAIYDWIGIKSDAHFPDPVREAIKAPGQAKFHRYGTHSVIHVVGPNLHTVKGIGPDVVETAIHLLSRAYAATLTEFIASGASSLRLLPISGGIFAGRFSEDMPWMTFAALDKGFLSLPEDMREALLACKVEVCIFGAGALPDFAAGLAAGGAPPEGGAKVLSMLWPGALAVVSGLQAEKAKHFNGTTCTVLASEPGGCKYLVEMEGGNKATLPKESLSIKEGGALVPGVQAVVTGLAAEKAQKYNGTQGLLRGWVRDAAKWSVKLHDGVTANIPAANLHIASDAEPDLSTDLF